MSDYDPCNTRRPPRMFHYSDWLFLKPLFLTSPRWDPILVEFYGATGLLHTVGPGSGLAILVDVIRQHAQGLEPVHSIKVSYPMHEPAGACRPWYMDLLPETMSRCGERPAAGPRGNGMYIDRGGCHDISALVQQFAQQPEPPFEPGWKRHPSQTNGPIAASRYSRTRRRGPRRS